MIINFNKAVDTVDNAFYWLSSIYSGSNGQQTSPLGSWQFPIYGLS